MPNNNRPKIGIALSGASGRAIAHIGVLEVLKENKIPIDYIVGCSSGALIASAYATDTMDSMKELLKSMTVTKMLGLWSIRNANGGLFHLHNVDPLFHKYTKGMTFEQQDVPKLGFVATDINTGELITLKSGDMTTAIKAAVAVPGLFEPVVLEDRILVDGGLVNIVPTKAAREMGADIVIGVNIAATKFIYEKRLPIWRGYKFMTRLLGLQFVREKIMPMLSSRIFFQFDSQSDVLEDDNIKVPGVFSMLAKALDHSLVISEQWTESDMACDLMLEPRVKHYGKAEFGKLDKIYEEGRRAAQEAIPLIRNLIKNNVHTEVKKVREAVRN
jgi:NTE family protein